MLYIVATPIGNLGDITDRAKEILNQAELTIAENPAYSKRLLNHLKIEGKQLVQFAEHNEQTALPKILKQLQNLGDKSAALISDAGTPGISDPGFRLVRAAIAEGITVSPIPGANAAVAALCASGLPTNKFLFMGFVPKTEIKLIKELQKAEQAEATAVFYESPHRIEKTCDWLAKQWPNAHLVLARELSKIHEEFLRGSTTELAEIVKKRQNIKGEFVVMLSFK